jgi:hypothetical protein
MIVLHAILLLLKVTGADRPQPALRLGAWVNNLDALRQQPAGALAGGSVTLGSDRGRALSPALLWLGGGFLVTGALLFVVAGVAEAVVGRPAPNGPLFPTIGYCGLASGLLGGCLIAPWFLFPTTSPGQIVLRREGVEFLCGPAAVFCPWALFGFGGGKPYFALSRLVLPVARAAVDSVELRLRGAVTALGREVCVPFFRFRSDTEVELKCIYQGVNMAEVGSLLLHIGGKMA